jgi:hypothetical protein
MIEQITILILVILIVFFAFFVIFIFINLTSDVRKTIETVVDTIERALDQLEYASQPHEIIDYNLGIIPVGLPGLAYDKDYALFLMRLQMSTLNIALNTTPRLPSSLKIIKKVGDNQAILYQRQNTNFYILCFRGSLSLSDIIADLTISSTPYKYLNGTELAGARVQKGFYDEWISLRDDLLQVKNVVGNNPLMIAGDSLGADLAMLTAVDYFKDLTNIGIYTFASPRVGNNVFIEQLETIPIFWDTINVNDIFPDLPPPVTISIGQTSLYDTVHKRVVTNMQTGTVANNHYINTLACSLNPNNLIPECPEPIIWSENPRILVNFVGMTGIGMTGIGMTGIGMTGIGMTGSNMTYMETTDMEMTDRETTNSDISEMTEEDSTINILDSIINSYDNI